VVLLENWLAGLLWVLLVFSQDGSSKVQVVHVI
jgi:hypothetical protein